MAGLLSSVAAAEERRRRLRRWRRHQLAFGGGEEPAGPDYSVFPFTGPGINLPRNLQFHGYGYSASPLPIAACDELASVLPPGSVVRLLCASPRDRCSAIPQDVTAGPSGKLEWIPNANALAEAETIRRLNARGIRAWLQALDGIVSYAPKATWAARGNEEMHAFMRDWAAWLAAQFNPHQVILAAWNENPDTDPVLNNTLLNLADAGIREGAPHHWCSVAATHWSSDWTSRISAIALNDTSLRFVDGHAYVKTDTTWAGNIGLKKSAAEALGMPFVYGEIGHRTAGGAEYDSPTNVTRIAEMAIAFAAAKAADIPMVEWNDKTGTPRVLNIVDATEETERSLTWIPEAAAAMVGAP